MPPIGGKESDNAMRDSRSGESEGEAPTESDKSTMGNYDAFSLDCAEWLCQTLLTTHDIGKFSQLAAVLHGKPIPLHGRLSTRLQALWLWQIALEQLDLSGKGPANCAIRKRPDFTTLEKNLIMVKDAFLKDDANEWYTAPPNGSSPNAAANNSSGQRLKRPPFHGSEMFNKNFRYVLFLTRAQQKFSELLDELQRTNDGQVNCIIEAFEKEWGNLGLHFDDCLADLTPTKRSKYILLRLSLTDGESVTKVSATERIQDIIMDPSHPLSFPFLRKKIQGLLQSWSDAVLTKPVFVQVGYQPESNVCRFKSPGESHRRTRQSSPIGARTAHRAAAEYEPTWTDHDTDDDDRTLPMLDRRNGKTRMSDNVVGTRKRNRQQLSPNSSKSTPAWKEGKFLSPDRHNGYDRNRKRHSCPADESKSYDDKNGNKQHQGLKVSRLATQKKPIDVEIIEVIELWRDSDDDDSDDESTSSLSSDDRKKPNHLKSAYYTPTKKPKRESSTMLSPEASRILESIQKDWED